MTRQTSASAERSAETFSALRCDGGLHPPYRLLLPDETRITMRATSYLHFIKRLPFLS
jgi:hypothetical protein